MVKLAGLVHGMSAALQVPASRVRTAAAQLRKHKLLTTGPRGPGAPEMAPPDAVNLLLAIMYDAELAVADQSVVRLRTAPFARCRHRKFGEAEDRLSDFPRNGIFGPCDDPLSLGEVLETILDWFVRYGTLEEGDEHDLDLSVINLWVRVSSPGYASTIHFNTHEGFWDLTYEWKSPEQIAYEVANRSDQFARRWDALNGSYLSSSRTVGEDSLYEVANLLRGRPWNDADEEIAPPYDNEETQVLQVEDA